MSTITEQSHNVCQHCKDKMGLADRTQAYTCPVCGKVRCILCHARVCRPKVVVENDRKEYR